MLFCTRCYRSLRWVAVRQLLKAHPHELLVLAVALAGVAASGTFTDAEALIERTWLALAAIGAALGLLVYRWLRNRERVLREVIFHTRRADLAHSHGLRPTQIQLYASSH